MRPDYDGIKYYGKNDISIGWELEDSEEKMQGFSSESTVENVNEAIELFNIAQLLDTEVRLRKWDENIYNGYKAKSPLLMKLCAKFFAEINNDSFMEIEESVCISYLEDFWMLIEKFKVYERIDKDTFKRFLEESNPTLWVILKHKRIVDFFGQELSDVLRISEQTPELIAHNFLEAGEKIRYYFPKELLPSEYEGILKRYPDKYYLYKYNMFVDFAKLIDYADLPKAGDIDLVFMFESMCDMILKRVMQDEELLKKYASRRNKYYDPEYHLLVQDIVYSAIYFDNPEVLDEKDEVDIKEFTLQAKEGKVVLKGTHIDHIQEAKSNKEIGDAGEEFVYQYERAEVKKYKLGEDKQVRRVAKLDGDGLGYDILSYDIYGNEKYIEVKTTSGPEDGHIFITANELVQSEKFPE